MIQLIKNILRLAIPLVLLLTLATFFIPANQQEWLMAVIDKHKLMAKTISPKIVLAGSSAMAYGVNSERISKTFGIPVINHAVTGSFGLSHILVDISKYLNSGDYLVITPQNFFSKTAWEGTGVNWIFIIEDRDFTHLYSRYFNPPPGFLTYGKGKLFDAVKKISKRYSENPYVPRRDGFNGYGDFVQHLNLNYMPFGQMQEAAEKIRQKNKRSIEMKKNKKYFDMFFELIEDFSKRGVTIYVTCPAVLKKDFEADIEYYAGFDTAMRTCKYLTVVSKQEDYVFPVELFYDTDAHTNAEGRELRTTLLIADLSKHLNPR